MFFLFSKVRIKFCLTMGSFQSNWVLTFYLTMWYFLKVRIEFLPFLIPCDFKKEESISYILPHHVISFFKSKNRVQTLCHSMWFLKKKNWFVTFSYIAFLPFALPCDFFFQQNRYSTFSLPCVFFFSFSNLRIEFFCLAMWLFQTNRVLPSDSPCVFCLSKVRIKFVFFYLSRFFFFKVRIEFLPFSWPCIFFSKVRIDFLPFALPCGVLKSKNRVYL